MTIASVVSVEGQYHVTKVTEPKVLLGQKFTDKASKLLW